MQQLDQTHQILRLRSQNIRLKYQVKECEKKIIQIEQKLSYLCLQNASQCSRIKQDKIMDRICSHIYSSQFGQNIDTKIQYLEQQNSFLKKQLKRIQNINIRMHNKMQDQRNLFEKLIQQVKNERNCQKDYFQYFQCLNQIQDEIKYLKTERQHEQTKIKKLQKKINQLTNSRILTRDEKKTGRNRNQDIQVKNHSKGSFTNLYKKDFVEETNETFVCKSPNLQVQSPYFKNSESQIAKKSKFFESESQNVKKNQHIYSQPQKPSNNYPSPKFDNNQYYLYEKVNDPETKINSNEQQQLKTSGFFRQPDLQQDEKKEKMGEEQNSQILRNLNIKFRKNIKLRK